MLAKEYNWLPYQIDKLDLVKVIGFVKILNKRNELKQKEKLHEQILYLMMIHTSKPDELLKNLRIQLFDYDDEIGDLKALEELKRKGGR